MLKAEGRVGTPPLKIADLKRFVAGADVFSPQSDGTTVAAQYAKHGITLRPANTDRLNGWAEGIGEQHFHVFRSRQKNPKKQGTKLLNRFWIALIFPGAFATWW